MVCVMTVKTYNLQMALEIKKCWCHSKEVQPREAERSGRELVRVNLKYLLIRTSLLSWAPSLVHLIRLEHSLSI